MADVLKQMAAPAQLGTTAATKYTGPASPGTAVGVMRHIHVTNPDTVQRWFTISIGADAAGTRIFDQQIIPPGGVFDQDDCGYVIPSGVVVQAYAEVASKLVLTISGLESSPNT